MIQMLALTVVSLLFTAAYSQVVYQTPLSTITGTLGQPVLLQSFNPYGMAVVTSNFGSLQQNDLIISGWNDANGNFGQGQTFSILRNDILVNTVTVNGGNSNIPSQCKAPNGGLGFTMALEYLKNGVVLQCNIPIPLAINGDATNINVPPKKGCCLAIDIINNNVLAVFSSNQIAGPWGSAIQITGNTVHVWISNALGDNNTGFVTRYTFSLPSSPNDWHSNTIGAPIVVATGFKTNDAPPNIQNGVVGPSGLAYDNVFDVLYIASTIDGINGQIFRVPFASSCGTSLIPCTKQLFINCPNAGTKPNSGCNNPIGINLISKFPFVTNILVANGGDNNLVEYSENGSLVTVRTINQTVNGAFDPANAFLFNIIKVGNRPEIAFVDDNFNSVSFIKQTNLFG